MTREEELALFTRLARDRSPAARDAIVERFLPLARRLARRFAHFDELDDLEQVAAVGLIKAIDRFDAERGTAFTSFAFPTILGELRRHLRDRAWALRVPRDLQALATRLEPVSLELAAELGRFPTAAELAEHTGSSVEQVLDALQARSARLGVSLDQPARDADGPAFEIAVEETGFREAEDATAMDGLLSGLSERERQIVRLRFGADLTQSEIGEIVGVTQMHVSRILRRTLERLRETRGAAA